MTQLHQIIALEKGARAAGESALTKGYHALQRAPQMNGIERTYRPVTEGGEQLPPESTRIQVRVDSIVTEVQEGLERLFDLVLTKDATNQQAKADIVVDGAVLVADVPVSTLLWLEKKLVDLNTFIGKIPTLDPAEQWSYEPAVDAYATPVTETARTKKIPRNHVKAEATDRHPAQVEMYYEDILAGYWSTRKFSGAYTSQEVAGLKARVRRLADAVKVARETANSSTAVERTMGESILDFLFSSSR